MKRFCLIVFTLLFSLMSFAISKDSVNAVTMVSYEQSWLDSKAALSLKNNTDKDVHNVAYRITYLNMSGKPLDYEDFVSEVNIAPGMTKKVDVKAYEHERNYSYYESEAAYTAPHKFKVKFELTGFNMPKDTVAANLPGILNGIHSGDESQGDVFLLLLMLGGALIGLSIYIGIYVLVAVMARNRNRSAAAWVIVSFFTTPILSVVLLLCIGKSHDNL